MRQFGQVTEAEAWAGNMDIPEEAGAGRAVGEEVVVLWKKEGGNGWIGWSSTDLRSRLVACLDGCGYLKITV
jgi:hypothetical protein